MDVRAVDRQCFATGFVSVREFLPDGMDFDKDDRGSGGTVHTKTSKRGGRSSQQRPNGRTPSNSDSNEGSCSKPPAGRPIAVQECHRPQGQPTPGKSPPDGG